MQLRLYNTISKQISIFEPIDSNDIKMYVCGPTVYDFAHIGNARSVVIYDVLYRILMHIYGKQSVLYVRNITDVDDKINNRAKELNIPIQGLTLKTTQDFWNDMHYLNTLSPNIEPKATQHIPEMIDMISRLIQYGYAYETSGTVYFAVEKFQRYYDLSGRNIDEMLSGARIEIDNVKKNPCDFVLWKPKDNEDDPSAVFDSPWGVGKPGWHIECSAMSHKYLGEDFDIHGGGVDLIFPHHTNEVAQSKCAYPHSKHAKFWVHNGFLTVDGEKMSKSLGNFTTVRDLQSQNIQGEVVRYALLSGHYRKPLDFSKKALSDAKENLDYLYRAVQLAGNQASASVISPEFLSYLLDDINTPLAFRHLLKLAKDINKEERMDKKTQLANELKASANLIGFLTKTHEEWFAISADASETVIIKQKILERSRAKIAKNFALADKIRDELLAMNIKIEDTPNGTKWFIQN